MQSIEQCWSQVIAAARQASFVQCGSRAASRCQLSTPSQSWVACPVAEYSSHPGMAALASLMALMRCRTCRANKHEASCLKIVAALRGASLRKQPSMAQAGQQSQSCNPTSQDAWRKPAKPMQASQS